MSMAYRCSVCAIDWPAVYDYKTCPKCDSATWHDNDGDPLTSAQARFKVKEIRFEKFYEERGEKPLTPEHAEEVAAAIAAAELQHELQHELEMWLRNVLAEDPD